MKKYRLLILSVSFFIIQFLNRWFSDQLFNKLFLLYSLLNFTLFILFIKLSVNIVNDIKKNKTADNVVALIILIVSFLLTLCFPYREIKTKVELAFFENDRNEIIKMLKDKEITPDKYGNAKLPNKYKKISTSGEVYIYQNDDNGMVIGFWIFRGMMSGSTELIYSTGGENLIRENENGHPIVSINKLKENWYYVKTDY